VCGASAAGKNALIETVARFLPAEYKKFLTGMTPKALMHSEENEFQHKAILIAEYEGVRGADYPIRTLQSEQRIEWTFVDHTTKGGLKKKHKIVRGPAAFIQATTRVSLHPENETRQLFIHIDESPGQTRAINLRQAQVASGKVEACPVSFFEGWQLADCMPPERLRSRRDLPKLLSLIECSAFLHQGERARIQDGTIVAHPDDYYVARELLPLCFTTTLERGAQEFLASLKNDDEKFSVSEMMARTGWRKTKAYEVLAQLEEIGCVSSTERGLYQLVRRMPEPDLELPKRLRLTADEFRISARTHTLAEALDAKRSNLKEGISAEKRKMGKRGAV
jgi:hypothetical protein